MISYRSFVRMSVLLIIVGIVLSTNFGCGTLKNMGKRQNKADTPPLTPLFDILENVPAALKTYINSMKLIKPVGTTDTVFTVSDDPNWNNRAFHAIGVAPLLVSAKGPGHLIVVSTLQIHMNNTDEPTYSFTVHERGGRIGTFTYKAKKMDQVGFSHNPNLRASYPEITLIPVPKGTHVYEFTLDSKGTNYARAQFYILQGVI